MNGLDCPEKRDAFRVFCERGVFTVATGFSSLLTYSYPDVLATKCSLMPNDTEAYD